MVSAMGCRSSRPGSSSGWDTVLCSWARNFTFIVTISAQVYKWLPVKSLLGVTLQWTSIPSNYRGSGVEIQYSLHCLWNWDIKAPARWATRLEYRLNIYTFIYYIVHSAKIKTSELYSPIQISSKLKMSCVQIISMLLTFSSVLCTWAMCLVFL